MRARASELGVTSKEGIAKNLSMQDWQGKCSGRVDQTEEWDEKKKKKQERDGESRKKSPITSSSHSQQVAVNPEQVHTRVLAVRETETLCFRSGNPSLTFTDCSPNPSTAPGALRLYTGLPKAIWGLSSR